MKLHIASTRDTAVDQGAVKKVRSERVRSLGETAQPGELVPGIARHFRYLSEFDDDVVRLDVRHHQDGKPNIVELDVANMLVACNQGRSFYKVPLPLSHFPEIKDLFKVMLNRTLARFHGGSIGSQIQQCQRGFLRIFAWMTANCIYKFSDLNRELVDALVTDVADNSWQITLKQDAYIRSLMDRARLDRSLFKNIYGRQRNAAHYTMPIVELEAIGGLPLDDWAIPRVTYEEFAALEKDLRPVIKQDGRTKFYASERAISDLMGHLNLLSRSTDASIKFHPFPNILKAKDRVFDAARKRRQLATQALAEAGVIEVGGETSIEVDSDTRPTVNLSVEECARLFGEALRWMYEYAPVIISTLAHAREKIRDVPDNYPYGQRKAWNEIYGRFERDASLVGLTHRWEKKNRAGVNFLKSLVKTLQFALFVVLGINTARRVNELAGEGNVPYGLHLGALVTLQENPPLYRLEAYVSKGPQQWFYFPANRLIADAYQVLKKLYELHEPFDAPTLDEHAPAEVARKRKLFSSRSISLRALCADTQREGFDASDRAEFFACAGVDHAKFAGSRTPFRRIFAVLFMHRYDLPEHQALQTYLGHLDAATTGGYYTDKVARPEGQSIQELHSPDYVDSEVMEELKNADLEYLAAQLLRMLRGDDVGGGFPVVVAKLARKLSVRANFVQLSLELKSRVLAERLRQKGHGCKPMKHTCCMAGIAKETGEMAKCFRDGSLHHEEASPSKCSGCVHSSASNSYLQNVKLQLKAAESSAANSARPIALKQADERRILILKDVIATEHRASQRNKNLFADLQASWEANMAGQLVASESAVNQRCA